tara:strand:- start:7718 stop:8362 length:645 start_codon:yes stop_codon:yes gene_type:complete
MCSRAAPETKNRGVEQMNAGKKDIEIFKGRVISSGFATGDMVVIGDWKNSPHGPFTNLMWAKPDGTRILIAPSQELGDFVSSLYSFEEVIVSPMEINRTGKSIEVSCDLGSVSMEWGMTIPLLFPRPRWFIANVEAFFARLLFGTKTHGTTRNGLKEWYHVRGLSRMKSVTLDLDGRTSNQMTGMAPSACFGFSNPPRMPLSVRVDSHITTAES